MIEDSFTKEYYVQMFTEIYMVRTVIAISFV